MAKMTKAKRAAAARKGWRTRKMGKKSAPKKASSKKSAASKLRGKVVSRPKFAGNSYACRGKKVRSGKSRTKTPRVFCARSA